MSLVYFNNIEDSSVSTGTGPLTLTGVPPLGKEPFSARLTVGNTFYYTIRMGADVENGIGTYSAANEITRTTVKSSSNSDAPVNFGAGIKEVILTVDAEFYGSVEPRLTGATVDTAPEDSDTVYGGDSGSTFATIKTTWTTIKAFLKTYFDGLYATTAQGGKADAALPAASFTDTAVTGKLITGFTSGAGTVAATDTILQAINKLDGNVAATLTAAQSYADALVVGLIDDRGNYNASGNTYPATGGSGTAGAILKGDLWVISVAGTLNSVAVSAGDQIRALCDTPGQTPANWAVSEANIGYVPEVAGTASSAISTHVADTTNSHLSAAQKTVATQAATASQNGYATSTQITKLDGIATGATANTAASTVTTQAFGDAGTVGTGMNYARDDHKHAMPAAPITSIPRSPRTSNTILVAGDLSTLVDITSGTFTQTFTAAATLGSGWFVYLRNSGTGEITLDPNGSETIDGLTSYIMYPGECRLIQCDGSGFNSVVLEAFSMTVLSTITFTKPPGYINFGGFLWPGGGSGARGTAGTYSGGGGGGACNPFNLLASALGATETITIGAGGSAITGAAAGNAGGTSSIGTLAYAYGGGGGGNGGTGGGGGGILSVGGVGNSSTSIAGTGGNGGQVFGGRDASTTNRNDNQIGSYGGGGGGGGSANGGIGFDSIYGGAGGGCASASVGYAGGTSWNGKGHGGAGNISTNGVDGTVPGGGGGGTRTGTQSGAGGNGACRIWGII